VDVAVPLVGGILLIALFIAANGYFVAQEFAYMAVDRGRLKALAAEGDDDAQRMLAITGRTSFMLSGAQLGITVTGLLVGYVAEPLVGTAVGELLGGVGLPTGVGLAIGTVGALVVATFVQMLFGELFPKNLAIATPYPVARALARSTRVYMALFGWLIQGFDLSSRGLLKLLRIEPVEDVEHSANLLDLRRIVSASRDAGELPDGLSEVLDRMLDFPQRDVSHALVPRSRVDVIAADTSLAQVREVLEGGHSRYPVLDAEGDVVGVIHLSDVLHADDEQLTAADVARSATVVPTRMPLPRVLAVMSEARHQMVCVVDEYGGLAGILTAEDLVEEVVGELTDEHDDDVEPHLTDGGTDREWTVRGDAPLDEVAREIGMRLPDDDAVTVAGLVIATLGELPEEGQVVDIALPPDLVELAHDEHPPERRLRATVLEVSRYVPQRLRLELLEDTKEED
jgi:CBS domain containing-hemolysin-like protein